MRKLDDQPDPTLASIEKRLAIIESLLQQLAQSPAQSSLTLYDTETKILAVLAKKPLKGAAIARRLDCGYNSSFKTTLSHLVRAGVLAKGRHGYFVAPRSGHVRLDATGPEDHDVDTGTT